jgi:type II secretory pathway pseudopilin PulG
MNKLVAVLAIIIILLSGMCGILYYQIGDMQSQNSELQNQIGQLENQVSELELKNLELQNQTSELEAQLSNVSSASQLVRIIGIEITGSGMVAWPAYVATLNVTIQNFETSDVEGLRLTTSHISGHEDSVFTVSIEFIHAEEVIYVRTNVGWSIAMKPNFVATLTLDDIILDKRYFS